jgi:sodium/hydrogen antiporter
MIVALITVAVILILYGAISKPLDARGVTSAMIFTAAGLAVGTSALKLVNIHLESLTAERFCELALPPSWSCPGWPPGAAAASPPTALTPPT